MNFERLKDFPEIIVLEPDIHGDQRGHFLETYRSELYLECGLPERFVQDNLSYSRKGVLRGLHYQLGRPQGKLVSVILGEVFDVSVDIRRESPTFGQWVGLTLSATNYRQIYIPEDFAHGFCVLSETAILMYKCTEYYAPKEERGLRWNDPSLGIEWPVQEPIISDKDSELPILEEIPVDDLPNFGDNVGGTKGMWGSGQRT
jgi:dTDP-4-dehydrorhamnose 3,5-epimerase